MSYQFASDVERLLREQMALGHYNSEDDLLRDALVSLNRTWNPQET
jgi:Arc/MetJ-type ribon-helix-helix transcriptional regulator